MDSESDPTAAVKAVLTEWVEEYGYSPRAINEGECLTFANEVVSECPSLFLKRTGDDDVLGSPENAQYDVEPFHVWVCDGSQHYDAEVPEGVADWRQLPFFQRAGFGASTDGN